MKKIKFNPHLMVIALVLLSFCVIQLNPYKNLLQLHQAIDSEQKIINTQNMIAEFENLNEIESVSFYCIQKSRLNNLDIEIVFSDHKRLNFEELNLLKGRFLNSSDINKKNSYAVLDKSLALQLFANLDCIGEEVMINNTNYSIIGIVSYKNKIDHFINNTPKIYLPYPFLSESAEQYIEIQCQNGTVYSLENYICAKYPHLQIMNFQASVNSIFNWIKILGFAFLLFILWLTIQNLRSDYTLLSDKFQKDLQDYYWSETIKINKKRILKIILMAAACSIIILLLFQFRFAINPNKIPPTFSSYSIIKEKSFENINEIKYSTQKLTPKKIKLELICLLSNLSFFLIIFAFVRYISQSKEQRAA